MKQEWKLEEGCQAQTSGGECEVIGIDDRHGMVAVRWHDGELGVVRIECVKKPPTDQEKWIKGMCSYLEEDELISHKWLLRCYDAGLAKLPDQGE